MTSNSAWGGPYFYTQTLYASNNYSWTSTGGNLYTCQGFIYNPYADPPIPPSPGSGRKTHFNWVLYSNKLRNRRNVNNM